MSRATEQFVVGQLVPGTKYRTRALIGSGGMGSVYEVEHTELGKLFVLKALRPGLTERTDLAARMKNEWRALGRLQHPNIVVVTDAGSTDDGVPYFVMERLEGETLSTRLRRDGRLSTPLALRISVGLLDALGAAHAIDVVHRDIKPQNVFLPTSGGVKLLDFGIAKLAERDRDARVVTVRGVAIGTPRYMSPEQAEGKTVDGRTDIYAVALVLFEMIAGKGPFSHRRDPNELVLAHMSEMPQRLDAASDVAPELADLVQRWLAKSPSDRPSDAIAAAQELRAFLGRYTFDASLNADQTSEPTAHANYEASTHAGGVERAPKDGSSRDRTLSLGTLPLALDEAATHVEGAAAAASAVAGAAKSGSVGASGGDTVVMTNTMTPADAPTTRTVLPALRLRDVADADAQRRRVRERAPRSETPPPVEPPRESPERPWLRLGGVAAVAAGASFALSVFFGQLSRRNFEPMSEQATAAAAAEGSVEQLEHAPPATAADGSRSIPVSAAASSEARAQPSDPVPPAAQPANPSVADTALRPAASAPAPAPATSAPAAVKVATPASAPRATTAAVPAPKSAVQKPASAGGPQAAASTSRPRVEKAPAKASLLKGLPQSGL